jgi:hypothetical protein
MPIKFEDESEGKVLAIQVSGKLAKADYVYFAPEFERLVKLNGQLRVLFDLAGKPAHCGRTSSSTLSTSRTSNGLQWSGTRSGNMAWLCSASPSRAPRSDTSIVPMPLRRGRGWTKRSGFRRPQHGRALHTNSISGRCLRAKANQRIRAWASYRARASRICDWMIIYRRSTRCGA